MMIIIGHSAIKSPSFIHIKSVEDIEKTIPNDIVWFENDTDFKLSQYCKANDIGYAIRVDLLKDVVIAANLGATYIIVGDKNLAEMAQKIANEYFFDSKILYIINDDGSIENMAMLGIDGVIFNSALKS